MSERRYLKDSVLLCGECDGERFKRRFTVKRRISEGASVICYEACHSTSSNGVLKEFRPIDAYQLVRRKDGQLVHTDDNSYAKLRFDKQLKEYLEPYELLLQTKRCAQDNALATFIPNFEIYRGCDENGNAVGTVYIWTPEPELETFDRICDDIHRHPTDRPEHKLVLVLTAIETLTKCICMLHSAGMLHRDIKPSNFGFLKRGKDTLTQTLSMFDINSVCSVYNVKDTVGTPGYMEPEAGHKRSSNQSDIYAIGATLYTAIVVSNEAKKRDYRYSDEMYDELKELVDSSRLIRASESNSHPRLKNALTVILQKCLCPRKNRYSSCEELLEDIDTALYYALPSEIARKRRSGEKWVLTDAERSFDKSREKNSSLSIQYHLYREPLYRYLGDDANINVYVIGFGNYGQKFLDICLQAGQFKDKKLNVTVVSKDMSDKEIYLDQRRELGDFFDIDTRRSESEGSYGKISFETCDLSYDQPASNMQRLEDIILGPDKGERPHYVFIALGDDKLNRDTAAILSSLINNADITCNISYAWEGRRDRTRLPRDMHPVYVNEDIKSSDLYTEIERMAFNAHLVWKKDLNIENKILKTDFRKKYNHDSCVSNVLSLKYKLYNVGIDLDRYTYVEAAELFEAMSMNGVNNVRDELIALEHRRWVAEKLCLGWTRIKDLEECVCGETRDEKRKRHVCLVKSRADRKLAQEYDLSKWDKAFQAELDELDELDRVSLELHRVYARKAKEVKKQNLLTGNTVAGIRALIDGDSAASAAFSEWLSCMKGIWNGEKSKVALYENLKGEFLKAADGLASENKRSLREQIKALEAMFYPVFASMQYLDFKQNDALLVDNIPFILTYSDSVCMVIPLVLGNTSDMLSTVVSVSIANPALMIGICRVGSLDELGKIKNSLAGISACLKKKHIRSAELVIIYDPSLEKNLSDDIENEFAKISYGIIAKVKAFPDDDRLYNELKGFLTRKKSGYRTLSLEKNDSHTSRMLGDMGFYDTFGHYCFDSASMRFDKSCYGFEYIKKTPHFSVNDMLSLSCSFGINGSQPEFFGDYAKLWERYREDRGLWCGLCDILHEHSLKNDVIASFKKRNGDISCEHRFIIPFLCRSAVKRILDTLKQYGMIGTQSFVNGYTTDSCEVVIYDMCGQPTEYEKLFSHIYALTDPSAVGISFDKKEQRLDVIFDDLNVRALHIGTEKYTQALPLLEFFKNTGYIIALNEQNGTLDFTYATRQIKQLLTDRGRMLEVYVYHKAKESACFDDVVSNVWLDVNNSKIKLDCVLTKDFYGLLVKCVRGEGAETEKELENIRLAHSGNQRLVLLDCSEGGICCDRIKDESRGVYVLNDVESLDDIGETLLKIITK